MIGIVMKNGVGHVVDAEKLRQLTEAHSMAHIIFKHPQRKEVLSKLISLWLNENISELEDTINLAIVDHPKVEEFHTDFLQIAAPFKG